MSRSSNAPDWISKLAIVALSLALAASLYVLLLVAEQHTVLILLIGCAFVCGVFHHSLSFERWKHIAKHSGRRLIQDEIAKLVLEHYRPLVRVLEAGDEVSLAARQVIAAKGLKPLIGRSRVVFIGSVSNQTTQSKSVLYEDSERTPSQVYQGAIEELMSKQQHVYRILGLLDDDEYNSRSLGKRREYINWLKIQLVQLRKNKNYIFIHNRRAPKWGTPGAGIFSSEGFMQFSTGHGTAIFIQDGRLSFQVVNTIVSEIVDAKAGNKQAYTNMEEEDFTFDRVHRAFGEPKSVSELEKHIARLELALLPTTEDDKGKDKDEALGLEEESTKPT